MYFKTLLLLLLLFFSLEAKVSLERNYFVENRSIMLSDIVKNPQEDFLLYEIEPNKNIKRVRAIELLETLKRHGYNNFVSAYGYIQFNRTSTLDLSTIKTKIKEHYQSKYTDIKIDALHVQTRESLHKLPDEFAFGIQKKEHLSSSGHCYIVTPEKKKIFFSYQITAFVSPYYARRDIKKGSELSNLNVFKKSIMLSKFTALPLQVLNAEGVEAKHKLKKDKLITSRDVTPLYVVKRGEGVNVTLVSSGISISFSAKALTNARVGDSIFVLRDDKKKIKVRVTGKNRAEM